MIAVRSDNEVNPGKVLHGFSLAILCIFIIEVSGLDHNCNKLYWESQ